MHSIQDSPVELRAKASAFFEVARRMSLLADRQSMNDIAMRYLRLADEAATNQQH